MSKTKFLVAALAFALGLPLVFAQAPNITTSVTEASAYMPGTFSTEVTSGSGYDSITGSVTRRVVDFEVPGSVGNYPLNLVRTYTSPSGWHWSFLWAAREQFMGGGGYDYTKLDQFDDPMTKHTVWIGSPDGKSVSVDGNYAPVADDILPGNTYDVTRSANNRITSIVINFPDGGRVRLETFGSLTASVRYFRPVWLDDPYGLRTTYTYTGDNGLPDQITDASGRWLKFYGNLSNILLGSISRVESSAGQWANFSATTSGSTRSTTVSYWDGTGASYQEAAVFGFVWGLVSATDVKAKAAMRSVEYTYAGSYLPAPNGSTVAWVEMATEKLPGGPVVSTRTVLQRNGPLWANGRPYLARQVRETRGDGPTRTFTVEPSMARPLSFTDFRGNTTSYEFTAWGLFSVYPTKITDALGRVTTLTLDTFLDCRPTKVTNPDGAYRQFTWVNHAFIATVRDELGRLTTYTRDAQNRITRIDYPDGSSEAWTYNGFNQPTVHTLKNGGTETFVYDSAGRLQRHWLPTSPDSVSYTYYPSGNAWADRVQTVTDPLGNVTTYEYNARGQVTTETLADGNYRAYTYDDWGNRTSVRDELGNITAYAYDVYNRLTSTTDPLAHTTQHDYTPMSGTSSLSHTAAAVRTTTSPTGRVAGSSYDSDYHVTEEIRGQGSADEARTTKAYDAVGNVVSRTEQVSPGVTRVTTFGYDALNRKRYEYAPLGRTTEWQYDAASNVTKVVNPDGTFSTKAYDSMNRVSSATDEMGYVVGYAYTASGQTDVITDRKGYQYHYEYDAADRKTKFWYPAANGIGYGSSESWTYAGDGRVADYYNRSGQHLHYTYDNRRRETLRAWDGGAAPSVSTGYDAAGRVTSRSNSTGTLGYTYDNAGRVTGETQAVSGGPTVAVGFDYDNDNLRNSRDATGESQLGFGYNARGDLTAVNYPGLPFGYTYDLSGARTLRTSPNGTASGYFFDGASRLATVDTYVTAGHANILRQDFGRDLRDRRTWSLRDSGYGDAYTYQADSELTGFRFNLWRPDQNPAGAASSVDAYVYDQNGNRTTRTENGAVTTYTPNALNEYSAVSSSAIAHNDGRGNVTQWQGWSYNYDAENRLTTATATGQTYAFAYDAQGRLAAVTHNGIGEYRFFDGSQLFLRKDAAGTALERVLWGPSPDEALARWTPTSSWQYFHHDPLNSPAAITGAGGTVTERYLYDAFGMELVFDAAWNPRSSSAVGNPWGFTGQEAIAGLGLHNYKGRFYSDDLGRFLQQDPVRFDAGDLNLYRYCGNEPVDRTDPMGLTPAAAAAIWASGMSVAGTEEASGWIVGGNFNPVVDVGIGGTLVVAAVWAGVEYFHPDAIAPITKVDKKAAPSEEEGHRKPRPSTWEKHTAPRAGGPEKKDDRMDPPPPSRGPKPPKPEKPDSYFKGPKIKPKPTPPQPKPTPPPPKNDINSN